MSALEKRGNNALQVNPNVFHYPTSSDINITTHGSDWYWAVTGVMIVCTMAFIGLSFSVPRRNRIFHYITAAITMVASIAYFTMASNLGYASIMVEFMRTNSKVAGVTREIFYVRYIDWFVTTPVSVGNPTFSLTQTYHVAVASHGYPLDCWSAMAYHSLHHLGG